MNRIGINCAGLPLVLAYEDCKALVKAEPADRRVIVRVIGGDSGARRSLLAIIRYDLDRINGEFKDRLDAQPKVPLTDFPEFSVDYKRLLVCEKQGVKEFLEVIGQRVVTVQVNELLNGVDFEKQREESLDAIAKAKAIFFSYSHKPDTLASGLAVRAKQSRDGVTELELGFNS